MIEHEMKTREKRVRLRQEMSEISAKITRCGSSGFPIRQCLHGQDWETDWA